MSRSAEEARDEGSRACPRPFAAPVIPATPAIHKSRKPLGGGWLEIPLITPLAPLPDTEFPALLEESPLAMPVQITITASSLEELWNELSAFSKSSQGLVKSGVKSETSSSKTPDRVLSQAVSGNGENPAGAPAPKDQADVKRGPGRPPKNPKPPQLVQTQQEAPEEDDEENAGESEEHIRHMLTAAITQHWRQDIPAKKKLIRDFRAAVGIGSMVEMKQEHFPAARTLLTQLADMGEAP